MTASSSRYPPSGRARRSPPASPTAQSEIVHAVGISHVLGHGRRRHMPAVAVECPTNTRSMRNTSCWCRSGDSQETVAGSFECVVRHTQKQFYAKMISAAPVKHLIQRAFHSSLTGLSEIGGGTPLTVCGERLIAVGGARSPRRPSQQRGRQEILGSSAVSIKRGFSAPQQPSLTTARIRPRLQADYRHLILGSIRRNLGCVRCHLGDGAPNPAMEPTQHQA